MMHDSEKCYRKHDRLSDLPDEVLHHILSFLPTYEAIATCLVSTRWRFLWTMVPSLHFHCTKPISYERDINRFLRLRTTKAITRFHLNGKHYPYPYYLCTNLKKWVDAAKRGNVEHLSISLCKSYKRDPLIMGIPSLFMCTTLVTLNLNLGGSVSLTVPSSVHLPSLKTLHLDQCIKCFHDAKRVFYGCTSLELFHLRQSHKSIDFMELKIERSSRVIRLWERKGYHTCVDIVIESDRDHDFVRDYIEGHLEKLVKVKAYVTVRQTKSVNIFIYRYISFRTLKGLSNVEFLSLRDFLPWTSYIGNYNNEEFNGDDLPQFQNLVKLRLYIEDAKSIHRTLPAKCPKLQLANPDHGFSFNKICQYHATR